MNNNEVNQILPNGFGYRTAPDKKSEAELYKKNQNPAIEGIYSAFPNAAKKIPVDLGEDGLLQIPDVPNENYGFEQNQQGQQSQQNQQSQPTQRNVRNAEDYKFMQPQQQPPPRQSYAPPSQAQQESQKKEKKEKDNLSYHPVVQKLLKNFGLKKDKRHSVDIYNDDGTDKMTYTMVPITEELQSWAVSESKDKISSSSEASAAIYFELLYSCCAIVAIDNQSTWEIFNIEPQGSEYDRVSNDPFDMSARMRKLSARMLAQLLWSETRPIGDKLLSFYQDVVMEKKIISSHDKNIESKVRYVCPRDACDNYEFLTPEMSDDGSGIEKVYYCKNHGIPLIKTVDLMKESNIPLA